MLEQHRNRLALRGIMFALLLSGCSDSGFVGNTSGGDSDGGTVGTGDGGTGGTGDGGTAGSGSGYLHTSGGQIVDSQNQPVRLTGVSWFGMETDWFAPHGLDKQSLSWMLDKMQQLGYNMIRIPYCSQMLDAGSAVKYVDYTKNPELKGKTPLELLDKIVEQAGARKMRVVLDRHRPDAYSQSNLWYSGQYTEQRWIDDWKMLAARYKGNATVVGFDLHNEPHGEATWGSGNMATDWRLAAERAGNAVLSVNPELLIIVEGIENVNNQYYWWGGNLMSAGANLVRLSVPNRVVYSPHDYPASVYGQSWFSAGSDLLRRKVAQGLPCTESSTREVSRYLSETETASCRCTFVAADTARPLMS